jgi:hypothetical protein
MILATSGNIGIGTTSPNCKLDVFGSGVLFGERASSIAEFRGSQTSTTPETILRLARGHHPGNYWASSAEFNVYRGYSNGTDAASALGIKLGAVSTDNPDTTVMTLWANGNVGIGTSSPGEKLVINGKMELTEGVIRRGGSSVTGSSDLGLYSRVGGNWIRYVTNGGDHAFFTGDGNSGAGSDERMRIAANGTVAISGNLRANGSVNIGSTANASGDTLDIKGSLRVRRGDTNPWDAIKMYTAYDSGLAEERAWISAENAAYFTFITS